MQGHTHSSSIVSRGSDLGGRQAALSQNCLFEAKLENRVSENQWFASPNFPVFGNLRQSPFADLTPQDLAVFELIVGADICFWEDLVDPLYQLVCHGVAAGVPEILVADPGRPPFDELCARCVPHGNAEVLTWALTTPVKESGRILRVVGAASC